MPIDLSQSILHYDAEIGVYYGRAYIPYSSDAKDDFTLLILDLKDLTNAKNGDVIRRISAILDPILPKDIAIVTVPSSDAAKLDTGIRRLGQMLARDGRTDGTGCLVRHTSVSKAATGGSRSIATHGASIRLNSKHILAGKPVLLMDDVTTTGSSLHACRQLLRDGGINDVTLLAIGRTMRPSPSPPTA